MSKTYDTIATTTLTSAVNSFTFNSIPSTYTDLRVIIQGLNTTTQSKRMGFNGDTGNSYMYVRFQSNNGAAPASQMQRTPEGTGIRFASDQIADSTTVPMNSIIDIFSYNSTNWYKSVLFQTASEFDTGGYVQRTVGMWNSLAAITSVTFIFASDNWAAGTTATLYGIRAL